MNSHVVRVKEEEEPMEVDTLVVSDRFHDQPITKEITKPSSMGSHHLFSIKAEEGALSGNKATEQLHPGAKMVDQCLHGLKTEDRLFTEGCQSHSKSPESVISGANKIPYRVKMEGHGISGAKMTDQLLFKAKIAERQFSAAKMSNKFLSGAKMEDQFPTGAKMENQLLFGTKTENGLLPGATIANHVFSGAKAEEQLFFGAKMEDQFISGAKMADQCLRAVLWQDMSVNLASTLLHQLSGTTHASAISLHFYNNSKFYIHFYNK